MVPPSVDQTRLEPQRSNQHISTELREREGKALTNFSRTLPAEDSDLTQQILRDPYSFEFLTLSSSAKERELERGLLKHLRDLLLELGP
jgi:predicted nuclease of restriction endonuclease-like (RecB) superfamily